MGRGRLFFFEIWNALGEPTNYIDISDVEGKKRNLINMYTSQTKYINYADRILSLNHYRGMCHNINYEECYQFKKG